MCRAAFLLSARIVRSGLGADRLEDGRALGKLGGEQFVALPCGVGHRSSGGQTFFGGAARIVTVIGFSTHVIPSPTGPTRPLEPDREK